MPIPDKRKPYRVARGHSRARSSHSIPSQLRRHSVALISLLVALVSLGYNTWRNETSELQRNWRQAAFEMTMEVNQLQQIVLYRRYFYGREEHVFRPVENAQTWIKGWGTATSIRDLSRLLPEPMPTRGAALFENWQANAGQLHEQTADAAEAEQIMLDSLDELREAVLAFIHELR